MCVRACVRACVRSCVRAFMRACVPMYVCACVRACMGVRVRACTHGSSADVRGLNPKCTQCPSIHTNYSLSNCTNLQYNHMTRYLGRNEILNTKDIEFNSVAISVLWHEMSRLCRGQIKVAGIRRRHRLTEIWRRKPNLDTPAVAIRNSSSVE